MILHIDGDINRYYVQTLCMIFFPGSTFPDDEEPGENVPELTLKVEKTENGYKAFSFVKLSNNSAECLKETESRPDLTDERCCKIAVGASVAGGSVSGGSVSGGWVSGGSVGFVEGGSVGSVAGWVDSVAGGTVGLVSSCCLPVFSSGFSDSVDLVSSFCSE